MRRLVAALFVLMVSGCTQVGGEAVPSGGEAVPSGGGGPVTAQVEVLLRPVDEVLAGGTPEPPDVLADAEGAVYRLGPAIGDLTRFEDVSAVPQDYGWVVLIELGAEDTQEFAAWTAEHVGDQLAIVVDGELVTAPTVHGAIHGVVQISGDFSEQEAKDLVKAIRG